MLRSLSAIEQGIAVVDQNAERWFDAELYRLRGEFTLRRRHD